MTTAPLLFAQDGPIVTLTINRPETRNPISDPDMIEAFEQAVGRVNADQSVRVLILTGSGSAFSSGGNLRHMRDRQGMFAGSPAEIRAAYQHGIQRIPKAMMTLEVPSIAAVNGPAIGAGCDLACMCDMRLAATTATFAESFVKVGIVPGDGGAWFLPRAVGMSRACEMAFTGDAIGAEQALAWGLVSEVAEPARLMERALALAQRIAVNPPQVLRMTKRLLQEGQHLRLDSVLEMSASMQALAHHTADHAEAVNALLEKRPPRFEGR
jgi:enoyl-CoA hydratase/carnithine racemase